MLHLNEFWISFILGVIEGLTEFLPVSSTGHMILIGSMLSFSDNRARVFEVIVQCGSILAVLVKFRQDLFSSTGIYFGYFFLSNKNINRLGFLHIFWSILPILIFGYLFYRQIKSIFEVEYVIYALVVGSMLLLFAEYYSCRRLHNIKIYNLNYLQTFFIGCVQCFSLCPGFSRSGATVSGCLLVGLSRHEALKFSFFIAVPVMFAASVLDVYNNIFFITNKDLLLFCIGFFTSFVVSLVSIKYSLIIVNKISFVPFAIYRCILAIIVYYSFIYQ